jgi:F0F1-type ATP synthase membrane subunit b/b'
MNCPHCNAASPEGKKFCSDCGSTLDPEAVRFEARINEAVEETLSTRFKEQKFIELETSQAIAERLHAWAKLFGFWVGLPIALLLVILSVLGIEKYSDFRNLVDGLEKQVRPKVEQAKASAEQAQTIADDAQKKAVTAEETAEGIVKQVNEQLGSATQIATNVHKLSLRVSGLEATASGQMKASTERVEARVTELNSKIDVATKDIAEQQKKLASTDELVKAMFSKGQTEYFVTSQPAPNIVIVPLPDPQKGCFVYMLLKSVPIFQTTEIKWRVASQPRGSYNANQNVLFFFWGDPADSLKQYPLEVTYVPDPTVKASVKKLTLRDNAVYADDLKLADVPTAKK